MENYTVESKLKALHHDNYVENSLENRKKNCVSCWMCIYCGKNKTIPVVKDKLLCAKYITEIAIVQGKGTCDSARSRFKRFNFVGPIKKMILERHGFNFKAR
jgi:hypothetical protein